jgi:predicted nucleotidyltransferase component of viral defense system
MTKPITNLAASLRAKLLNHARDTKQDFQFVLDRWIGERFLFRLGQSKRREQFVLKGATLFLIWKGQLPRPTRDVDLLGYGSAQVEDVISYIKEICSLEVDDGIVFDLNQIEGQPIREDAEYQGVRVWVPASLDNAKSKLQIDIGFGDAVDPAAEEKELPVILKMEPAKIKAYPPEVAIAEKLQAMVHLGMANSRMKDFFDIWLLSQEQSFLMSRLQTAITATFERRKTQLPDGRPSALSDEFLLDKDKNTQWKAFLERTHWPAVELKKVGEALAQFLIPVIEQARDDVGKEHRWSAGGPWKPKTLE